jgi:hypothetical protein
VSFDAGKYARPERERRFLLAKVPPDATDPHEIVDRYLVGTRLRVRTITSAEGRVYKLGQKVRPDPADPGLVMHTTCYLSRAEYDVLAALPAHELRKTRRRASAGRALSVDEFHDELEGLVLAEVDLELSEPADGPFRPPDYCLAEVTADERFTGGQLAVTDRATLLGLLEVVRRPPPERRD